MHVDLFVVCKESKVLRGYDRGPCVSAQLGSQPSDCGRYQAVLRDSELRLRHLPHQPAVLHVARLHPS